MDCGYSWEYSSLINELTLGLEHAKQLRAQLNFVSCSTDNIQELHLHMQMILSSYEKSFSILNYQQQPPASVVAPLLIQESSVSVDHESPKSDDLNGTFKDNQDPRYVSKKRKQLPTWTEQVRVSAESGFEGPTDDGYSWRKYGQKDILGATYPRSYYRCTYRLMQNCWATKQVQRSDDDPALFEITYKGSHTCNQSHIAATQPKSPEKQELKKQATCSRMQSNQMLANLQANLRVNTTDDLDKNNAPYSYPFSPTFSGFVDENLHFQMSQVGDNLIAGYNSPSFVSPTTPESNYFSVSSWHMDGSGRVHNSESDLTELFSANTSSTSSPIVGLEFPLEDNSQYSLQNILVAASHSL